MYWSRYARCGWYVVYSTVWRSGTACEQFCLTRYAAASSVALWCLAITRKVMAGCLVS